MTFDAVLLDDGLEKLQKPTTIVIVIIDGVLGITSRDDVIERAWSKDPKRTRHATSTINGCSSLPASIFQEFSPNGTGTPQKLPPLWTCREALLATAANDNSSL